MSDRWTEPSEERPQLVDEAVDETRLTALDRLVLPRRRPMLALAELGLDLPASRSTFRNLASRDRVIE